MTVWEGLSDQVDWPYVIKGASAGFSVLIIGFYAGPLMANVPVLGEWWILVVSALAGVAAGWRIGDAVSPPVHGAVAALGAHLLFLPVVALVPLLVPAAREQIVSQLPILLVQFVVGAVVGGLVGGHRARRRDYS